MLNLPVPQVPAAVLVRIDKASWLCRRRMHAPKFADLGSINTAVAQSPIGANDSILPVANPSQLMMILLPIISARRPASGAGIQAFCTPEIFIVLILFILCCGVRADTALIQN